MGTLDFLKLVLPFQGKPVLGLAQPKADGGVWFKWKDYNTAEEAASAALYFDVACHWRQQPKSDAPQHP